MKPPRVGSVSAAGMDRHWRPRRPCLPFRASRRPAADRLGTPRSSCFGWLSPSEPLAFCCIPDVELVERRTDHETANCCSCRSLPCSGRRQPPGAFRCAVRHGPRGCRCMLRSDERCLSACGTLPDASARHHSLLPCRTGHLGRLAHGGPTSPGRRLSGCNSASLRLLGCDPSCGRKGRFRALAGDPAGGGRRTNGGSRHLHVERAHHHAGRLL